MLRYARYPQLSSPVTLPPSSTPEKAFTHSPATSPTQNDRASHGGAARLAAAASDVATIVSTRNSRDNRPRSALSGGRAGEPELTPRDRAIVETLARMRILSFAQVHARFFAGRSIQAARHRLGRLAAKGWLSIWRQPVVRGGHPAYAIPTDKGMSFAREAIQSTVAGTAIERLIERMLPTRSSRPLFIAPCITPPWLAHQRECNSLVLAIEEAFGDEVLWASTWDRPFPNARSGLALPQPDAVLVFQRASEPVLVFLEHDRGQESLEHFRAAKIERYAELSVRPELAEDLLGFSKFEVWVTVLDARFRRPRHRLATLSREVTLAGAESLFLFSLAGWVHDDPRGARWYRDGDVPLLGPGDSIY